MKAPIQFLPGQVYDDTFRLAKQIGPERARPQGRPLSPSPMCIPTVGSQRGGRFKRAVKYAVFKPARTSGTPKLGRKWRPRAPRYPRTVLGNHWISKSGWGTGLAPSGCPNQNACSQYEMPPKGPPRNENHRNNEGTPTNAQDTQ
jgi:hypothetical protein